METESELITRELQRVNLHLASVSYSIDGVSRDIGIVGNMVEHVAQEHAATRDRVEKLYAQFEEFVARDAKQKEVQLASVLLTDLRAEIERRFGHYAEIRRHTTGILQAADAKIVREETIHAATERLMLSCPGYWLAPALVALSSWIVDNQALAQAALAEAMGRDASKSSLFFALICRRADRLNACAQWLRNYLLSQNPAALEREATVLLDAIANGVFGGTALALCSGIYEDWIEQLEREPGFAEEQERRWARALGALRARVADDEYPTLRRHCTQWPEFDRILAAARRNQLIMDHFLKMFTGEIILPAGIESAVDELLEPLVTYFDSAELPLRQEERRLALIMEENGDKEAAEHRFKVEAESLRSRVSFAEVLTNAAMHPEHSKTTPAARRYAVAHSRNWILAGFQILTAGYRDGMPAEVAVACGSWKGASRDGSNEAQLRDNLTRHYAARITREVARAGPGTAELSLILSTGIILGLILLSANPFLGVPAVVALAVAFIVYRRNAVSEARMRVQDALEKERANALAILRASLSELADLRREIANEDAKADHVLELLASFESTQFVQQRPEQPRAVV